MFNCWTKGGSMHSLCVTVTLILSSAGSSLLHHTARGVRNTLSLCLKDSLPSVGSLKRRARVRDGLSFPLTAEGSSDRRADRSVLYRNTYRRNHSRERSFPYRSRDEGSDRCSGISAWINPGVDEARDSPPVCPSPLRRSGASHRAAAAAAAAASGRTEPGGASPTERRARRPGLSVGTERWGPGQPGQKGYNRVISQKTTQEQRRIELHKIILQSLHNVLIVIVHHNVI